MNRALLVLCLAVFPLHLNAQQGPRLRVVVEEMDADAAQCGISKDSVTAIARLTLRNNRIELQEGPSGGRVNALYVNTNVLAVQHSGGSCVFSISVDVRGYTASDFAEEKLNGFGGKKRLTRMCGKEVVGIAARSNASKLMLDALEQHIKLCLGDLEY